LPIAIFFSNYGQQTKELREWTIIRCPVSLGHYGKGL